jgi:hypothetical protein
LRNLRTVRTAATSVVLGLLLLGCSGGGSSSPSVQGPTAHWAAPQSFTDNTILDPAKDLQGFEIAVKRDNVFGPNDNWVFITPGTATRYLLPLYDKPTLSPDTEYFLSLRAVTVWDTRSDPSPGYKFTYKPK